MDTISPTPPAPASTTTDLPSVVAELQAVYDALKDERILREETFEVKQQELEIARANLAAESHAGSVPSVEIQLSVEMAQQAVNVAETAVSEIISQEEEANKAFEYAVIHAATSASADESPAAAAAAAQSADAKTSNATLIAVVVAAAISVGLVATLYVSLRIRARKNMIPEHTNSFENPVYDVDC